MLSRVALTRGRKSESASSEGSPELHEELCGPGAPGSQGSCRRWWRRRGREGACRRRARTDARPADEPEQRPRVAPGECPRHRAGVTAMAVPAKRCAGRWRGRRRSAGGGTPRWSAPALAHGSSALTEVAPLVWDDRRPAYYRQAARPSSEATSARAESGTAMR